MGDLQTHEKSTQIKYRPNAKFPWLISQRNQDVKLSESQMDDLIRRVRSTQRSDR